jgi:competence protein ComEC
MRAGITQSWLLQCGLVLCMVPATAYFLGGFSLAAPIYNWVFIPLVSIVVVPVIFTALVATHFWPNIAMDLWTLADRAIFPLLWSAHFADDFWLPSSKSLLLLVVLLVMVYLLSPLLRASYQRLLLIVSVMVALIPTTDEGWRIDMLDVGQGLSLLIEKNGHYVIYDTGSRWSSGSMAKSVVEPVLQHRGATHIDGLIISHIDNDHAGGRTFIEDRWTPEWRRSSQILDGYLPCRQGEQWQWQGLSFNVVWPPAQVALARNRYSCVVRIYDPIEHHAVIMTGDVDALSEWLLIRGDDEVLSEVMVVPHHGSRSSSSSGLIDAVQPNFALASLAKGNQWGMPDPHVVQRYTARNAQWLDTGSLGQITVIFRPGKVEIMTKRRQHGDAWYRQMLRKQVE